MHIFQIQFLKQKFLAAQAVLARMEQPVSIIMEVGAMSVFVRLALKEQTVKVVIFSFISQKIVSLILFSFFVIYICMV